jgi:succinyl-diaminopimelate desuccinylase
MEKNIIELSSKLISVPSTKENSKALEDVLQTADKYLKGFNVRKFKRNGVPSVLYYNTPKLPKRFKVILNAHLDVVPAEESQYKAKLIGDKLYGRGTNDMKAAAATEILAFKEMAKKVKYPLGLQLVTDEEIGGFNGTGYQIEKGVRADFVIAGEGSNLDINNMSKGVLWLKLKSYGKTAHSAYLWNGQNALSNLNTVLNRIWKVYPIPKKEVWKTTVNIGRMLTENQTFNKVPDYAEAWLDIRYIPEEIDTILLSIKKLLSKGVEIEVVVKDSPHYTKSDNKYIGILKKSIKGVTGKKVAVSKKHGANDIRHFNKVGCDGVQFGPTGEGLHTDKEWVSIKSLSDYYNILENFLMSLS